MEVPPITLKAIVRRNDPLRPERRTLTIRALEKTTIRISPVTSTEEPPMTIRTEFNEDDSIDSASLQTIMDAKKVFLGNIHGYALTKRGQNDNHVLVTLLSYDNDHWRVKNGMVVYSTSWIQEEIALLQAIETWCEQNCEPDTVYDGKQYGWEFK